MHPDPKWTLTFREWPPRARLAVSGSDTGHEHSTEKGLWNLSWIPVMVPPTNGGVETKQLGEKGLQNLTKIKKEAKHIPCVDVGLQRRMLHFTVVTNDKDEEGWKGEEEGFFETKMRKAFYGWKGEEEGCLG